MPKFKKKPVVIEARQLIDEASGQDIAYWCGGNLEGTDSSSTLQITVPTLEGVMTASFMDWVIKGVKGEFYPCKPDIFDATYDPKSDTVDSTTTTTGTTI